MRDFIIIDLNRLRLILLVDDDLAIMIFDDRPLQFLLFWIFEDDVDRGIFVHFLLIESSVEVKLCLFTDGIAEENLFDAVFVETWKAKLIGKVVQVKLLNHANIVTKFTWDVGNLFYL